MTHNPSTSRDTLADWFRHALIDERISATARYRAEERALVRQISHLRGMSQDTARAAEQLEGRLNELRTHGRLARPDPAWKRLLGRWV